MCPKKIPGLKTERATGGKKKEQEPGKRVRELLTLPFSGLLFNHFIFNQILKRPQEDS
jgi:hypothetical protein